MNLYVKENLILNVRDYFSTSTVLIFYKIKGMPVGHFKASPQGCSGHLKNKQTFIIFDNLSNG